MTSASNKPRTLTPLGIVRCVDDLGRLCLPKELRDMLDIHSQTRMEFLTTVLDECHAIVLRKFNPDTFGKG